MISIHAMALNAQYEFDDGEIQTEAFQDNFGYWTGPGGTRFYLDGRPVKKGDVWPKIEALKLYAEKLQDTIQSVRLLLTRPANANQLGAMVLLAWNVGTGAFRNSTVLREHNAGNKQAAAAGFHLWRYGTLKPGADENSKPRAGPDGHILEYDWLQGSRGVFRRNCATGLLYLGLEWGEATASERIHLEVVKTIFQDHKARWFDIINEDTLTPWDEIVRRADGKFLADMDLEAASPDPALFDDPDLVIKTRGAVESQPKPVETVMRDPTPETPLTTMDAQYIASKGVGLDLTFEEFAGLGNDKMLVTNNGKLIAVPRPDPTKPPKPMEKSETFRGLAKQKSGKEAMGIGGTLAAGSATVAAVKELTSTGKDVTSVARDTSDFVVSFTMNDLLVVGLFIGLPLAAYGLWRVWRGSIIAYEGRKYGTQGKV